MKANAIPEQYADRPELVAAVIDARTVQMETEDTAFAIEWLIEHHPHISLDSAKRVLEDETFRYRALYPDGHPGLEALLAEGRSANRRAYALKKLRPQIIDRDDGRCQSCNKRVVGREATLDHKDPEGPTTPENLHLLCHGCNALKGKRTWEEFLQLKAQIEAQQNARPDIICQQTGLSIRGRSWKEAGCLRPPHCAIFGECDNGEYEEFEQAMDAMVEDMAEHSEDEDWWEEE